MTLRFLRTFSRCLACTLLIMFLAPFSGGLFVGWDGFLGALFGMFVLCPVVIVLGVWIALFPPRTPLRWIFLSIASGSVGIWASWLYQFERPFDWYHEADGSMPGWEPVHMASPTTFGAALAGIATIIVVSLIYLRSPLYWEK